MKTLYDGVMKGLVFMFSENNMRAWSFDNKLWLRSYKVLECDFSYLESETLLRRLKWEQIA